MEGIQKKHEETLGDIIERLQKTSAAFQASHKLKEEEPVPEKKRQDQFKIIPPPPRSFIDMSQPKENEEPFRGIED